MRRGPAGAPGRRPRGLRAVGPAGRGHRRGHRRRRHRDRDGGLDAMAVAPGARELARIPARALTSDAIVHERLARRARRTPRRAGPGVPGAPATGLPERGMDPGAVLLALLGSAEPRLAGRGLRAVRLDRRRRHGRGPGRGAAVLRIKGTTKALVAATDANQAVGALDPWLGAALSVAEATRNVSITGARPLGVTNCLNFGDPTRPDAFWQLPEAVRGLGDACRALGLPVTGGNVSLYNESPAGPIAPTPRSASSGCSTTSRRASGRRSRRPTTRSCSSARRRRVWPAPPTRRSPATAAEDGPPALDLPLEAALQAFVREAIARGPARVRPGRLGRRARGRAGRGRDVGRARGRPSAVAGRPLAGGRPVRREPVAPRRDAAGRARPGARRCSPASTACRSRRSGRSVATGSSSSSRWPARPAPPRSAAAASPTRSTSPSRTSATRGRTA